ncbi:MAG: glycosyl hydrolase family 65 protein, partial [Actinomycetota bacterium]|nr:glycosyl hydrolase family 65 protein [Actinomycetota bacterium]
IPGSDSLMLVPESRGVTCVSVGREPTGVPDGVIALGRGPDRFVEILVDQLRRRERGDVPELDIAPGWTLTFDGIDHERERAVEAVLTLADGTIGTSGAPLCGHESATPGVVMAGVYRGDDAAADLLDAPRWDRLERHSGADDDITRTLDLHTGVLAERVDDTTDLSSIRFSSLARPGTAVLRVRTPHATRPGTALSSTDTEFDDIRRDGSVEWSMLRGKTRAACAAATQELRDGRLDRFAVYEALDGPGSAHEGTMARLFDARAAGVDVLLAEHRRAWAQRWAEADIVVAGDDDLQLATRVALFHLMASVATSGDATVGARGLTGHGYRGHVFWDSDVFVLPFLAATHPAAARAMLEYRVRRLPIAQDAARAEGRLGARFPWESATFGDDVTPHSVRDATGQVVPIRTGTAEAHIVADVAWAAAHYVDWTGDAEFAAGGCHLLLVETARYWASRVRVEHGGAHVYGVIGPDEYHEPVDDNMFTNVLARWNLRRAAASAKQYGGVATDEQKRWLDLADALVDGYDPETRVYEQFAGFHKLEPLLISQVAPRRPIVADLLLGRDRVRAAQVVKQADVLMAHHLVPDECAPSSLEPNLDFYEPRTAHGSSLSPGVHASLLARAGRLDDALALLRLSARVDLDDVTQTTAGGVHLATMGSVWQALAWGFGGIRALPAALGIDPRLPPGLDTLELRVQFRGVPVRIQIGRDATTIVASRPVAVAFGVDQIAYEAGPDGITVGTDERARDG